LRLIGQAWVYRVGNSVVRVENAFAWIGWAQERLIVNDEAVTSAQGWFGLSRSFEEDWLTPLGEGVLRVRLVARMMGIDCIVKLDDQPIEPEALEQAVWSGAKGEWPASETWAPAQERRWHATPIPPNSRR
jgi:hypothetical protein